VSRKLRRLEPIAALCLAKLVGGCVVVPEHHGYWPGWGGTVDAGGHHRPAVFSRMLAHIPRLNGRDDIVDPNRYQTGIAATVGRPDAK